MSFVSFVLFVDLFATIRAIRDHSWTFVDIRRFFFLLTLTFVLAMAARTPVDSDLFWHLRAGEQTLSDGRPLTVDTFSHTRTGERWVNHSWLGQVTLALAWRAGGWMALSLWVAVLAALGMAFVWQCMEANPLLRPFVIVLAATVAAPVWTPRPQLLSLTLFAFLLWYLHRWERGKRAPLWLLPPLFLLWGNLHGGYPLGLLLIGAYLAGGLADFLLGRETLPPARWRALAAWSVLAGLAVALNPNGWRMWLIPFQTVGVGVLQQVISEWASPDFHQFAQQPFIWLLLATLGALAFSRKRATGFEVVSVALFAWMGLTARRNFGPFALTAAPVLARHLEDVLVQMGTRLPQGVRTRFAGEMRTLETAPAQRESRFRLGVVVVFLGLALLKGYAVTRPAFVESVIRAQFPADAVAWIKENHPQGNLFNEYNWGGYLIWALPEYPVAVDGRTDLYGDPVLRRYLDARAARAGWETTLQDWDVRVALLSPGAPLGAALNEAGWQEVYRDDVAVVWER